MYEEMMGRHMRYPRFLYHVLRVKGFGGSGPGMRDLCAWFRTCSIVVTLRSISCRTLVNGFLFPNIPHTRTW